MMLHKHPKWIILWTDEDEEQWKIFDNTEHAKAFGFAKMETEGFAVVNGWTGELFKVKDTKALNDFFNQWSAEEKLTDEEKQL